MRLTPKEPEIPEVGGFTEDNDIFGYRDFADSLASLLGDIDEPLVIALDGPWGSGKSVFVKQWAGLLRARGAAVIYFDAFANDHYEDAFLALSAEIHLTAKKELADDRSIRRRYLNKVKKAGVALTPIALRVAARAGTAGLLSSEDVEAGSEALKAANKALKKETAKVLENVISERLREASNERAALQAFRMTLSEVARTLAERRAGAGEVFPLIFIVDELDRCRPPFALGIIERIKHLFSVPGVCFVLVGHLPQLEQVIQGAYGATFDARTYLEKFYQLRVFLPEERTQRGKQNAAYVGHLWNALEVTFGDHPDSELVRQEIEALAVVHDLPLRRLERVVTHVALAGTAHGARMNLIPPLVAGLCVMRETHPALYKKARRKQLTWDEALNFLQPPGTKGVEDEYTLEWWKMATGGPQTVEMVNKLRMKMTYSQISDQMELLSDTAGHIDDLHDWVQRISRPDDR